MFRLKTSEINKNLFALSYMMELTEKIQSEHGFLGIKVWPADEQIVFDETSCKKLSLLTVVFLFQIVNAFHSNYLLK